LKLNKISSFIGVLIIILMVNKSSNKITESTIVHIINELLLSVSVITLLVFECLITYKLVPFVNSLLLARIRFTITVMITFSCILSTVLAILSLILFKKDFNQFEYRLKWKLLHGGYIFHILSAVSQWISVLLLSPFIATYIFDLRRIEFNDKKFSFRFIEANSVKQVV